MKFIKVHQYNSSTGQHDIPLILAADKVHRISQSKSRRGNIYGTEIKTEKESVDVQESIDELWDMLNATPTPPAVVPSGAVTREEVEEIMLNYYRALHPGLLDGEGEIPRHVYTEPAYRNYGGGSSDSSS